MQSRLLLNENALARAFSYPHRQGVMSRGKIVHRCHSTNSMYTMYYATAAGKRIPNQPGQCQISRLLDPRPLFSVILCSDEDATQDPPLSVHTTIRSTCCITKCYYSTTSPLRCWGRILCTYSMCFQALGLDSRWQVALTDRTGGPGVSREAATAA